jgi:HlyD family secretion protein
VKRKALIISMIAAVTIVTATLIWAHAISPKKPQTGVASQDSLWLVAGPRRVEPHSEDIQLAAEISGKLKRVYVEEGDSVKRGEVLAELKNDDYRAQVESAGANVRQKEAELRKVINGARREERLRARSTVNQTEAVMNNARAEMLRHQKLFAAGVISREQADTYAKEYEVARAQYEETVQSNRLIDSAAREEDRSIAAANLQVAQAGLDDARALLAKTYVRSPIDGVVLRRYHRAGESVSNGATNPDPIFTVGDTLSLRVRVDVDEADVSKLALGQKAYVTADAYGKQKFWGHVVRIGEELGPKNIRTDEPTERVDRKILETLVQLDPGTKLPVGLRVDAFIVGGDQQQNGGSAGEL